MENLHFRIRKGHFVSRELKVKNYILSAERNFFFIKKNQRVIFRREFPEQILFFDGRERNILLVTENSMHFFDGRDFISIKHGLKEIAYCKILNGEFLAIQDASSIRIYRYDLNMYRTIENIDSSLFLPEQFLFLCVRADRIFFMQLNGEFHREIFSFDEILHNSQEEYVDYTIDEIEGEKRVFAIVFVVGYYALFFADGICFLKYENDIFYLKGKVPILFGNGIAKDKIMHKNNISKDIFEVEHTKIFVRENSIFCGEKKISLIRTIDCMKKLFVKNRQDYYITNFSKNILPLPLYNSIEKKEHRRHKKLRLSNKKITWGDLEIKIPEFKFMRIIERKNYSSVQIDESIYFIWSDGSYEKFNSISSYFARKNHLIFMRNKKIEIHAIDFKQRKIEKKFEQPIFENATILSSFGAKIIFFIARGNFEVHYPKYFVEIEIKQRLKKGENFNGIFFSLKQHNIPFNFIDKKYRKRILKANIPYLIEYYRVSKFPAEEKNVREYLLCGNTTERKNYLIDILRVPNLEYRHIILLLIYSEFYDLLIRYVYKNNIVDTHIDLLKKYLSDDLLLRNILRTYDEKIIRAFYRIMGREYNFESKNLPIEVNEYLNDPVEKLKYIEDIKAEEDFICANNLYEEAIRLCMHKNRPNNFYYKLYSENTVGKKSVELLIECKEYELAIDRAVHFLEYASLKKIYDLINRNFILDEHIGAIYEKLKDNNFFDDAGSLAYLLKDYSSAVIYKSKANNYKDIYAYGTIKIEESAISIYEENSKSYFICSIDLLSNIEQTYEKYFKKFNSLQEYMDCEEMTASTVSSVSLLKGLKGLKRKLGSQKIKYRSIMNHLELIEKIDRIFFIERSEIYVKVSEYIENFARIFLRADEILSADENF